MYYKKINIFFIALIFICRLQAQSDKLIDSFKSNDMYYSAFLNGLGSVTTAINLTEFMEGNTSLQINYSFQTGAGSFFEVIRNYTTHTQDYSFLPDYFSLTIKGGNSTNKIKLRLWEDNDMNGAYDNTDEVFTSRSFNLPGNTATWQPYNFLINSFTKVTGNGNNQLDLNRIRAWDIIIENPGGNAINTTSLYIDDLRFHTTYVPKETSNALLTGSFIQLWNTAGCMCGTWTQIQWDDQFEKMKEVQLNKVIIQYAVYRDLSWYSPSNLSFINYRETTLNKIFSSAEKYGLKVYVGLYFDENWFTADKTASSTYSDLTTKHKAVIDEIYNLFSSSPSFGGWYIPQEIDDMNFQTSNIKTPLFNWLQQISVYAHSKTPDKPVMIAPFFNLWIPADVLENWYDDMLTSTTELDWIYPQDGVGPTIKDVDTDIPHYFNHIKSACDRHGKKFGSIVETYQQTAGWPIDANNFASIPTAINLLKLQLAEENEFNPNDLIQFEWTNMEPGLSVASQKLFDDYLQFKSLVTTLPNNVNIKNNFVVYPNPAQEFINIFPYDKVESFRIYSLSGNEIMTNFTNSNRINISQLPVGAYILELDKKDFSSRKLFFKK